MTQNIKKILNFSVLFFIVLICAYFWQFIELPFDSDKASVGVLSKSKYNHLNDTIRYIFYVGLPLLYYLFFILKIRLNQEIYKQFFFKNLKFEKDNFSFKSIWPIFLFLILLLIIEFLSLKAPNTFLDPLHHGDYLVPITNYLSNGQFWQSSFTVHGGSNIFYPLLAWKLFGIETIGAFKVFKLILVLILKILSITLVFYVSKFSKLETKYKVILFTILSLIILSFSNYYLIDYLGIRDIYALIFFIFFAQCFLKKENLLLNFVISLIAVFTIFLNIDVGVYLCIIILFYKIYLLLSKRFIDFIQIFSSLAISIILVLLTFGSSEISSFIFQAKHIILNIDTIHGLEFPQPFFSMGIEQHGSRATKAITLQLICGMIIFATLFSKQKYFRINEKLFFLFFYLYCLIAFKNALGRSDGFHIMQSSDWQSLIMYFFMIHLLIFLFKKNNIFKFNLKFSYFFSIILISSVMFSNIKFENMNNFKFRFLNSINATDNQYISDERTKIINFLKSETSDTKCIQNFTGDLVIPYLIKKPTCTKYFSSWLASGINVEKDYIKQLKNNKVKYILYSSPMFVVDNIKTSERLKYVNKFILDNYVKVTERDGYTLLKLKD